jgi:F-type H+-transporting ATPase subunit a
MIPAVFGEDTIARWGPIPVTATMLTSIAVSSAVVALGRMLARAARTSRTPRLGALARIAYRSVDRIVVDTTAQHDPVVFAVAVALFSFIAASTIAGLLPGVRAPTADLATAAALAFIVFAFATVLGVVRRGLRAYLRDYFRPNPLLFPIRVLSEASRTVALALRLFGNMMSGQFVVALLVALVGLLVPIPIMALHLLIGLLQAYIFTILACVYLGAALHTGEHP